MKTFRYITSALFGMCLGFSGVSAFGDIDPRASIVGLAFACILLFIRDLANQLERER